MASKLYGGPEPMKERRQKAIEHKRALELALFLGARDSVTDSGASEPVNTMGGLREYISSNVHDAAGTLSRFELDTFMRTDLQHGSKNKALFASPIAVQAISAFAADNWVRAQPDVKRWGVKVDAYLSGAYGWEVPVFVKRDWNDFDQSSDSLGGSIYVVDMEAVTIRPLRPTKMLRNRQAPGDDRVTEEYLTEMSMEVRSEKKHARIHSITG